MTSLARDMPSGPPEQPLQSQRGSKVPLELLHSVIQTGLVVGCGLWAGSVAAVLVRRDDVHIGSGNRIGHNGRGKRSLDGPLGTIAAKEIQRKAGGLDDG